MNNLSQIIHHNLSANHNTSQSYYYANQINLLIQKKHKKNQITLKDSIFNSSANFLIKYHSKNIYQDLSSIIQYYRYYAQNSVIFILSFYQTLLNYHQKHKFIQYYRLKKILSLSSKQNPSSRNNTKKLTQNTTSNQWLADLKTSFHKQSQLLSQQLNYKNQKNNQQSFLFQQLKQVLFKKFNNKLRINRKSSLAQIDLNYQNFFVKNKTNQRNYSSKLQSRYSSLKSNTFADQFCSHNKNDKKQIQIIKSIQNGNKIQKKNDKNFNIYQTCQFNRKVIKKDRRQKRYNASCQLSKQKSLGQLDFQKQTCGKCFNNKLKGQKRCKSNQSQELTIRDKQIYNIYHKNKDEKPDLKINSKKLIKEIISDSKKIVKQDLLKQKQFFYNCQLKDNKQKKINKKGQFVQKLQKSFKNNVNRKKNDNRIKLETYTESCNVSPWNEQTKQNNGNFKKDLQMKKIINEKRIKDNILQIKNEIRDKKSRIINRF